MRKERTKMESSLPEYYNSIPAVNMSTAVNYVVTKDKFTQMEFGALDYLVMTAVLLFSFGLSVSKTMTQRRNEEDEPKKKSLPLEIRESRVDTLGAIFSCAASTTSPFVNTLCLFGLTGEIYQNDIGVVFFLLGLLLSIPILYGLQFFSIIAKHKITSFPAYLKRRFQHKGISSIVAFSSILRHFLGGALNLCAIGIGVSAMTDLSAVVISGFIVGMTVFCTSMSRIHSGSNESIGGILIWIVGMTCLVTLTVTTTKVGGLGQLFLKAKSLGKLQLPRWKLFFLMHLLITAAFHAWYFWVSQEGKDLCFGPVTRLNVSLSPSPWAKHSFWGFLTIGVVMGFQLFAFCRSTLRHANQMPQKAFFGSLFATVVLILLWTFIGFWAGVCVSVAFNEFEVDLPDGLMAQLVSKEMEDIGGFRGFFVSALFAASVSGQTRRYNQLIELIWETGLEIFGSEKQKQISISDQAKTYSRHVPEDFLKELTWERRKRTCMFHFFFKMLIGFLIGALSCGVVFFFHQLNITVWEFWQGVVGIFIGPLVAAMLIGLFFPCISHMSVCLGLLVGWVIPCLLIIGNNTNRGLTPTRRLGSDLDASKSVSKSFMTVNGLNITLEETIYMIYNEGEYTQKMSFNGVKDGSGSVNSKSGGSGRSTSKILGTNYCFYGPIGAISCIVSSLLFAGVAGNCNMRMSSLSVDLLHPFVKKKLFVQTCEEEEVPENSPKREDDHGERKKKALKFLQETANI